MKQNELSKGLLALTVDDERKEVLTVLNSKALRLQYLKGSAKMGVRLWNVLSPQVAGYVYGPDSGVPTFSLETLKAKGLLKWF